MPESSEGLAHTIFGHSSAVQTLPLPTSPLGWPQQTPLRGPMTRDHIFQTVS